MVGNHHSTRNWIKGCSIGRWRTPGLEGKVWVGGISPGGGIEYTDREGGLEQEVKWGGGWKRGGKGGNTERGPTNTEGRLRGHGKPTTEEASIVYIHRRSLKSHQITGRLYPS